MERTRGNAERTRNIGIYLNLIAAHGRRALMGIRRYTDQVGNWHCQVPPMSPDGITVDISKWEVDGWIAFGRDNALGRLLARCPVPTVWISTGEAVRGDPAVVTDNAAIGRMAFDHLADRGYANVAYIGFDISFSNLRQAAFTAAAAAMGRPCPVLSDFRYDQRSQTRLCAWLTRLPKPVGVFACEDHLGSIALDCCRKAGLAVPQAVAVLGVDNDELRCMVRRPTLSSIETGHDRIGYEAAAMLDRILCGEPAPRRPLLMPPVSVVTRQSTDALALADEEVRCAVEFIRSRVTQPTTVANVIAHTVISPQSLDARFRRQLRSPILRYIQKVHVDHAIELLTSTDQPIAQVARASGFRSSTRMAIVFRRLTGRLPRDYRHPATSPLS